MKRYTLLLLVMFWAAPVFANGTDARAVTRADLIGTWENVPIPNDTSINGQYPYQLIAFRQDGVMKRMQSNKPLTEMSQKLFQTAPATVKFILGENGQITMEWTDSSYVEFAMGTYVTRDTRNPGQPLLKKGDIILSYIDQRGHIDYKQLIRKRSETAKTIPTVQKVEKPLTNSTASLEPGHLLIQDIKKIAAELGGNVIGTGDRHSSHRDGSSSTNPTIKTSTTDMTIDIPKAKADEFVKKFKALNAFGLKKEYRISGEPADPRRITVSITREYQEGG